MQNLDWFVEFPALTENEIEIIARTNLYLKMFDIQAKAIFHDHQNFEVWDEFADWKIFRKRVSSKWKETAPIIRRILIKNVQRPYRFYYVGKPMRGFDTIKELENYIQFRIKCQQKKIENACISEG